MMSCAGSTGLGAVLLCTLSVTTLCFILPYFVVFHTDFSHDQWRFSWKCTLLVLLQVDAAKIWYFTCAVLFSVIV